VKFVCLPFGDSGIRFGVEDFKGMILDLDLLVEGDGESIGGGGGGDSLIFFIYIALNNIFKYLSMKPQQMFLSFLQFF